jgi:hypothetical protein
VEAAGQMKFRLKIKDFHRVNIVSLKDCAAAQRAALLLSKALPLLL